jgi:hypothetical protein
MDCKLCGTHLDEGERTCPACGHVMKGAGREKDREASRGRGGSVAEGAEGGGKESTGREADAEREEKGDRGRAAGKVPEAPPKVSEAPPQVPEAAPKVSEAPSPVFALDAAGLRRLLARQPDLLEAGLGVFADDKGKPVGVGYATPVGDIDLLARDGSGILVVVRVADRGVGEELIAETLQRIGWVRKHLGKGKQKVRGIVLVEHAPDNLSYTASAVAGTITFKTYRVAVAFDDVEM